MHNYKDVDMLCVQEASVAQTAGRVSGGKQEGSPHQGVLTHNTNTKRC